MRSVFGSMRDEGENSSDDVLFNMYYNDDQIY
jgi:hypothetical protein